VRANEALRLSEERYARAMDASDAGHWDWNVLTGEMFQSARMKQLLGFPADTQFAGRGDWMARIPFHPDDRRCVEDTLAATLAGTSDRYEVDYRIVLETRETRWVRARGRVYRDGQGRAIRVAGSLFDMTERKSAEDELRLRKEELQRLMESVSVYLWSAEVAADGSYSYRYYSPVVERITGWPRERLLESRERWVDLLHPLDRPWVDEVFRRLMSGATEQVDVEYRIVRPDGTLRWVRDSAHGKRVEDGRILLYGVVGDITERKLGAEALRESEARFRALTKLSSDWYWEQDENLRFTYLSSQANELTGYASESSLGKTRWEIENMEPLSCSWAEHQAVLAARQPFRDLECRRIGPEGAVRYLSMSGAPVFDEGGRFRGYQGIGRNITERKRAEEKLRESESLKSAMFKTALDCIISMDHDGRVIEFNPAAERTFGYRRAEAIGKELAALIIPPRLREQHRRGLARYLATGEGPVLGTRVEMPAVRADGAEFPVELSVTRIPAEGAALFTAYLRDITERNRAEEQLRESEARFRSLTQISSDWYWRQDENLRFTYLSEGVSERAGWPGEDYIGRLRWEVPDIHLISGSWEGHKEVLAKRQPFRELEYWRPGKNGPVYTSISGAPIFDEHGRFKGYQGVGRNITERKRFEEALRLSEARYARAMDASADGLWEWNAASDELFISPRARELWGIPDGVEIRTRAELKAQNLQFTEDTICECIAQPSGVEMTYSVLNQAGELRWVRCVGKVLLGERGEPMLVTGSLTDVTERKLAADALRLSEEELRARQDMLDLAQKAARAVAFEWHIGAGEGENRWSPDLEIMYGLEPGSYDGTYETWKKLVFPADWPAVESAIKRANETGDIAAEYRVVHHGGAVRWLQAKGRVFFDDERRPARVVGFMLDVTDRHQAEDELRRLERQLRQAQRLEAMGTLAGGIAHDFNNILGAILGYGEMALRDAPKGSRLRRDVDSIITAGERGRALVERILAFSRSGVGERVAVHVEKIVDEALDLLAASLPGGVAVERRLRAGRAAVLGDPTQVHQVLMNLATNAVQAMPSGGTLRVSLEALWHDAQRVATVGTLAAGEYVVLEVADSGSGIPTEILERIFDPFFTTKEVGVGTGLGLSLVHGIVSELGGAIDVASTVGEGSVFSVYLPRAGEAASDRERDEFEAPRGNRQQVLIVDDEALLVTLATETLAELGYIPSGFTSSTAALAAFCADPARFDAVITDERMPGMSGSALIREIRKVRRTIPILLVSGYARGAVMRGALESGADEVLKKPLSARELATSLARVLRV
jgi:PAS domain S-box-containing protein